MEISRLMWAKKQPCWIKCQILWYYLLELKELKGNIDDNISRKVEILSFFLTMALRREKRHRDPPYSFTLSRKQQKTKKLRDNKEVEMKKIKIQ